ncbi:MAG: PAS domain S-box protein, partial [Bacteroidales bacterium]|nr:PAS domain S-box protein [Bacteroidales bacterium]
MNLESVTPEQYVIAGLALLLLLFLIIISSQGHKIKRMKRDWMADRINLEDASEKERWFKLITQAIPKAFWIFEPKNTIYVSPAFSRLTGISEREIRQPSELIRFLDPDFRDSCQEKLQAVVSGKTNRGRT